MAEPYGQELILDLHGCHLGRFNRAAIEVFFIELCELIEMERCDLHFWDDEGVPPEQRQTNPKTKGISAVQFIITSSIIIHALDLMGAAYINIFSCKPFDADVAASFTQRFFEAKEVHRHEVTRQ